MARGQERAHREGVADAVGEVEAAEFEVGGRHVLQFEELKLVAAQVGRARRMIHDLREQQVGEVLDDVEGGFGERGPGGAAQGAGPDMCAAVQRERAGVDESGGRDGAAAQARVRAVEGVINGAGGRAERELKPVADDAAELVERGRSQGREPPFGAKLAEHDSRSLVEVIPIDTVHFGDPIHVARARAWPRFASPHRADSQAMAP